MKRNTKIIRCPVGVGIFDHNLPDAPPIDPSKFKKLFLLPLKKGKKKPERVLKDD